MTSKNIIFTAIIVLIIVIYFIFRALAVPMMKVATGYAVKYVCSATFVSGLDPKIIESDLDLDIVNKVSYVVNHEEKYVEGTLFGFAKQRAWFVKNQESCGCIVSPDKIDYDKSLRDIPKETYVPDDTVYWPAGDRLADTILADVDYKELKRVVQETLEKYDATRAITVAYKNHLLAEVYAPGVDRNTRLLGWSMTKTMSNALIGNLVKNGMADIYKPVGIPEWSGDDRRNITLHNLLQMSSGLDWEEDYGKLSGVTRMLYLEPDMVSFSLEPSLRSPPDEEWVYSSGTSNILSGIIRSSLPSDEAYFAFPYDSLYDVIGMKSAVLETDAAGNYVFSSYCWATARDWTRFGLLYLNKGNWLGKPVFTEAWADYSTTPANASNKRYSAQIWLNAADNPDMETAPPDAYYEDGFGGQRVLIIPSRDLVIVMLSGQQKDFEFDYILPDILACFKD